MPKFKLHPDETVLPDDYNVFPYYVYIVDMKFVRSEGHGSVKDLKRWLNASEVRRCELFSHPGARLGDELE